MKNTFVALALLSFSVLPDARADDGQAAGMMRACEQLKRQADRDRCISEVVKANVAPVPAALPTQSAGPDALSKRAAEALAAASALESVVGVGISYNDYGPYIQRFAIALDAVRQSSLPGDEKFIQHLTSALDAYRDARAYWAADISYFSRTSNALPYAGILPAGLAGTASIISKYNIATYKADFFGVNVGAVREEALASIWSYARDLTADARKELMPQAARPLAAATDDGLSDTMRRIARRELIGSGCDPIGALVLLRRENEPDVISAKCSGVTERVQSVTCREASCTPRSELLYE